MEQLERRLTYTEQMNEDAEAERNHVLLKLEEARNAIETLKKFLADISRDWKNRENRVLGYVVLSPPIGIGVEEEGFAEDWAVIEIDDSQVDSTNFVGNGIDLGITILVAKLTTWMSPHPINPSLFKYPGDRILKCYGTIPDEEIWKPSSKSLDRDNHLCIMHYGHQARLCLRPHRRTPQHHPLVHQSLLHGPARSDVEGGHCLASQF
ncbi:hypothetical protein FRB95_012983 [Tulasnella sp. JGI-2019a]|nr:hypothetical protein FRB95_012983 [Tulasnella sp. JGI-2019a]